uniref:Uncharacterized protein n=1 Tax=Pseudo-nitzschia australis TaxID=44445 RepID=A0A7S4AQQ8_9STRA|mmetsp:Transcript_6507/g.13826  ORF Transcript_6507/g.13826 Transcript_6507/m.13826 type:complete len:205 (-) Transcript_6507:57-671(-)
MRKESLARVTTKIQESKSGPKHDTFPGIDCETTNTETTTFKTNSKLTTRKPVEKGFGDWLVDCIENDYNSRFLEWEPSISCWVVMINNIKIRRKVSTALYNWGKRKQRKVAAPSKSHPQASLANNCISPTIRNENNKSNSNSNNDNYIMYNNRDDENDMAYQFIGGRGRLPSQQGMCCGMGTSISNDDNNPASSGGNKRARCWQ